MQRRPRPRAVAILGALALLSPLASGLASAAVPPTTDDATAPVELTHDGPHTTGTTMPVTTSTTAAVPPSTTVPDHGGHDPDMPDMPDMPEEPDAPAVPGLTEETFELGPFPLAPQGQEGDMVRQDFVPVPRPEGDIAIRSIDWEFVDGNGEPVARDAAHLHHLVLLDTSRRDEVCGRGLPQDARFASTGSELTDYTLDAPYAYQSPADAEWQGVYMVMNTSDAPMDVSIRYTIGYTDGAADDFTHVDQYFFDVTGCWDQAQSEFVVPGDGGPGSIFEKSNTYTMKRDGTLKLGGGHLHPGGIDVTLTGPDGVVCRSVATHHDGADGHHGDMQTTPCPVMDEQFVVGDQYTLTTRYSNEHEVVGAMGIMAIYAHHTSPPPPEPTIDVEVVGLDGAAVVGTVQCDPIDDQVALSGSVAQTTGELPVTGYGRTETIDCGPEPVAFRVPVEGDGVLVAGPVSYSVSAYTQNGYAFDQDYGEVEHTGRTSLGQSPPDGGPLPISINRQAGKADTGPVVTGTITCDEPGNVVVQVGGWQVVGRYHLPISASQPLPCDGRTPFEVPITSPRGELRSYDATISVTAYPFEPLGDEDVDGPWEEPPVSHKTGRVALRNNTPEPDFTPVIDPDSPVTIGAVRRVGGNFEVDLTVSACPTGSFADLGVEVRPVSARIRGRWWNPREFGDWNWAGLECTGEEQTQVVTLPATFDDEEVAVVVDGYIYDPSSEDWNSQVQVFTGTTVTTK